MSAVYCAVLLWVLLSLVHAVISKEDWFRRVQRKVPFDISSGRHYAAFTLLHIGICLVMGPPGLVLELVCRAIDKDG